MNEKEIYRVSDQMGYTKLLVYKRKYNATAECYEDTLCIDTPGTSRPENRE